MVPSADPGGSSSGTMLSADYALHSRVSDHAQIPPLTSMSLPMDNTLPTSVHPSPLQSQNRRDLFRNDADFHQQSRQMMGENFTALQVPMVSSLSPQHNLLTSWQSSTGLSNLPYHDWINHKALAGKLYDKKYDIKT